MVQKKVKAECESVWGSPKIGGVRGWADR